MASTQNSKSIHISVSPRLYEQIKEIAEDHDIVSSTNNPKVTSTAREILHLFCTINRVRGVDKVKKEMGMTLKDIVRQSVYAFIDRRKSSRD